MHVMDAQAVREGIDLSFGTLLASCVVAGNAMTHVGGVTPYQVVMGRQPSCLPPITDDPGIELRKEARTREIALQAMISATSAARVQRALNSQTSLTGTERFSPGDLVELYRTPPNKDTTGWSGPCEVVECKGLDGVVILKIHGQNRPYRLQDVRHAYHVCSVSLVGHTCSDASAAALSYIHDWLEQQSPGRVETFGYVLNAQDEQILSKATRRWPKVSRALELLVRQSLQLDHVCTVRIGRGVHFPPKTLGPQNNITFNWNTLSPDSMIAHQSDNVKLNVSKLFGEQALHHATMQCIKLQADAGLIIDEETAPPVFTPEEDQSSEAPNDRLSTIPEESISSEAEALFVEHFAQAPSTEAADLRELCEFLVRDMQCQTDTDLPQEELLNQQAFVLEEFDQHADWNEHSLTYVGQHSHFDTCEQTEDNVPFVEMYVSHEISNWFAETETECTKESFQVQIFASEEIKRTVIRRETDIVTPEEMTQYKDMIDAATVAEYRTLEKYKCFKRIPKSEAEVLIDARFVAKWKFVDGVRGIRMRMALRGFREPHGPEEQNYSGTAHRASQKALVSLAACDKHWRFLSADVSKAFLQGASFSEIHQLTGEPEKHLSFTVPAGTARHLRQIPGYEDFNERTECLMCLKPGTGCRDAPKAFSLRLAQITQGICGLKPCSYDPQLEVLIRNDEVVMVVSKHVDDLKIAGEPVEVEKFMKEIEKHFGKLTVNQNKFMNCGINHERDNSGTISMDQNEYISAFIPINPKHYQHLKPTDQCPPTLQALYWSLLGAVAYTSLTQAWVAVYIVV